MKKLSLLLPLGLLALSAGAQQQTLQTPTRPGMYPEVLHFPKGQEPQYVPGTVILKTADGIQTSNEVLKLRSSKDAQGMEHIRYQQTIQTIPVEGAIYVAHVADGRLKSQNGEWFQNIPQHLATKAVISPEAALQSAMSAFAAKTYKWQLPAEEEFIRNESGDKTATFYPKATLVYYAGEQGLSSSKLRLAYKLDIYAHEPVGRRIYFVDAENGTILGQRDLIHEADATGTAMTGYSGEKSIQTESVANNFRLRETGRGNGIQTFNLKKGTNYSAAVDFTDADNYWNNINSTKDQYATDAHWGAEMTYDYFKNNFGRNSIDGNGFAIKSYVHYSTNYFNAFWDGSRMTYGDGNAQDGFKPLTSIDICGHEITHGLTSFSANLNYSYESGALNEGFSDIFGTMIEFYAKGETAIGWEMGDAFYPIRSMSDPKKFQQPNTYKGAYWVAGSSDYGGVHTNSGVLNYWFYLLAHGGNGTNDNLFAYAIEGIGNDKAAAIAYKALTEYLTQTSQYAQARQATIDAATSLYPAVDGVESNEVTQVKAAWDAVGVGGGTPAPPSGCEDLYEGLAGGNETSDVGKAIDINKDVIAKISSREDNDWFVFYTSSAEPKLKATLTNLPINCDIRLYSSTLKLLGSSLNTGTSNESITYNGNSGSRYYIQVTGFPAVGLAGAVGTSECYTLRITTSDKRLLTGETEKNGLLSNNSTSASGTALLFPNPADQNATLRYESEEEGSLDVVLNDPSGRVVVKHTVRLQKGANNISLDLSTVAPGMYFLQLPNGNSVKLFVQH